MLWRGIIRIFSYFVFTIDCSASLFFIRLEKWHPSIPVNSNSNPKTNHWMVFCPSNVCLAMFFLSPQWYKIVVYFLLCIFCLSHCFCTFVHSHQIVGLKKSSLVLLYSSKQLGNPARTAESAPNRADLPNSNRRNQRAFFVKISFGGLGEGGTNHQFPSKRPQTVCRRIRKNRSLTSAFQCEGRDKRQEKCSNDIGLCLLRTSHFEILRKSFAVASTDMYPQNV